MFMEVGETYKGLLKTKGQEDIITTYTIKLDKCAQANQFKSGNMQRL